MKIVSIVALFFIVNGSSFACSLSGWESFRPTLEFWEKNPGPAQLSHGAEGEFWESLPKPVVSVTKIFRAKWGQDEPCGDVSSIEIVLSLPKASTYDIGDFGFYFRLLNTNNKNFGLPDVPTRGIIEKNKVTLIFPWLDIQPSEQTPFQLEAEVSLVTNGLNIGKATNFKFQQK